MGLLDKIMEIYFSVFAIIEPQKVGKCLTLQLRPTPYQSL